MGKLFSAIFKFLLSHPEVVQAIVDATTKHQEAK